MNRKKLHRLLQKCAEIREDGFSIDIASDEGMWDTLFQEADPKQFYLETAAWLCREYFRRFHADYILKEECIANEVKFHFEAYMNARQFRGYHRPLLTLPFSRKNLIGHCCSIDISTDDFCSLKQSLVFGYAKGIREEYRGSEKDPFHKR